MPVNHWGVELANNDDILIHSPRLVSLRSREYDTCTCEWVYTRGVKHGRVGGGGVKLVNGWWWFRTQCQLPIMNRDLLPRIQCILATLYIITGDRLYINWSQCASELGCSAELGALLIDWFKRVIFGYGVKFKNNFLTILIHYKPKHF